MISREEVPIGVEVTTEPDEDGSTCYVHAGVVAAGQNHTASSFLDGEPSDEEIAAELIKVISAAAQMHGSGAWFALQRRLA
jgi:hypothetical protein